MKFFSKINVIKVYCMFLSLFWVEKKLVLIEIFIYYFSMILISDLYLIKFNVVFLLIFNEV